MVPDLSLTKAFMMLKLMIGAQLVFNVQVSRTLRELLTAGIDWLPTVFDDCHLESLARYVSDKKIIFERCQETVLSGL